MDPLKVSMISKARYYFLAENVGANESDLWVHWRKEAAEIVEHETSVISRSRIALKLSVNLS